VDIKRAALGVCFKDFERLVRVKAQDRLALGANESRVRLSLSSVQRDWLVIEPVAILVRGETYIFGD
jgi:hypothetical protein